MQVVLDTSSFPNTKTLKSTMNLPKMIYHSLAPTDHFGLKIIKNGYFDVRQDMTRDKQRAFGATEASEIADPHYLHDVIVLEEKQMNETVKLRYLNDFTEDLQEQNK